MRKILVMEDEDNIRAFVVLNLKRVGYDVVDVASGEAALEAFAQAGGDFDIAILDIMLPGIDGFEVCRRIREQSSSIGIIMLSAKSQEMDKVQGLMLGADDYITKPFSPSELLARVDAIYRRVSLSGGGKTADEIHSGPFILNLSSRTLTKNGNLIDLTQVEFQIMEFFMPEPQQGPGAQRDPFQHLGRELHGRCEDRGCEHPPAAHEDRGRTQRTPPPRHCMGLRLQVEPVTPSPL